MRSTEEGKMQGTTEPDQKKGTVDLILFAGQSNMSGRGEKENAVFCPPEAGFEYRPVSQPGILLPVREPFGLGEDRAGGLDDRTDGGTRRSGSMVSAAVAEYFRNTGRKAVAVSASKGGTETGQWLNGLLADALERLELTRQFLKDTGWETGHRFLVWCQGETDADHCISTESYIRRTEKIMDAFFSHGIQCCFLVQTGHYHGEYDTTEAERMERERQYERIRNAQLTLCREQKRIILAASFEPYLQEMKDAFHYYQTVYNQVGETVGKAMAANIR